MFLHEGLGVGDKVEVAEALLALAGEVDGLHRRYLVVACGILGVHKRVVVEQINLVVEEIGGGGDGRGDVGKHVCHGLVDGRPVCIAVGPFAILRQSGDVEGFCGPVPAEVGQSGTVLESFVQGNVLGWEITSRGISLARDRWCRSANVVNFEAV